VCECTGCYILSTFFDSELLFNFLINYSSIPQKDSGQASPIIIRERLFCVYIFWGPVLMLKFQGFQRFRLQKYSKYSTVLKIKILETVEISQCH